MRDPSFVFTFFCAFAVWLADILVAFETWAARRPPLQRAVAWWAQPSLWISIVLGVLSLLVLQRVAAYCRTRPTFDLLRTPASYTLPAALLPERYELPNICAGCGAAPARNRKLFGSWTVGNAVKSVTFSVPFCASCDDLTRWIGVNPVRVMIFAGTALAIIELLWQYRLGSIAGITALALAALLVALIRVWFRQRHYSPATVGAASGTFRFTCREFVDRTARMNGLPMGLVGLEPSAGA
jgi:hypothetical protein